MAHTHTAFIRRMTFGVTTTRGGHKTLTRHVLFLDSGAGWFVRGAYKAPATARRVAESLGQTLIKAPRVSDAQKSALRFYTKTQRWS